jgi:carbohydrate-selective porin OprB
MRQDDTVGIGIGSITVQRQTNGTPGPGTEYFVELFYKWRLTKFFSLQPDVQYYRTPGGDGRDALIIGTRLKMKL